MKNQAEQIRDFILQSIDQHPQDIVAITEKRFNVTRTTVHRHLKTLIKQGRVFKSGRTNNTVYSLKSAFNKSFSLPLSQSLSESDVWSEHYRFLQRQVPANIYAICEYGFTEMVNNAKDHSLGKTLKIESRQDGGTLGFSVIDDGIGIFKKIKDTFHFTDERESVLQLSKGKLTTDRAHHSGEGIFFSSRAFDRFTISANGLAYIRDNAQNDWFLEKKANKENASTVVSMAIEVTSGRDLNSVFERHTDPETYAFDKTHIHVNLSLSGEERFVSRSQAKRVLFHLEKFRHVILDFKGVEAVGQAFVDEVFRVFKTQHPDISLVYVNANDVVDFMIKRSVATSSARPFTGAR